MAITPIKVFEDPKLQIEIKRAEYIKHLLCQLYAGIQSIGLDPSMEMIKRAVGGENLLDLACGDAMSQTLKVKFLQDNFKRIFMEQTQPIYNEKVLAIVERIQDSFNSSCLNLDSFVVEDGVIKISDDLYPRLEKQYCIFIDTPARKDVYEKWLIMEEAIKSFDEAVAKAPKRTATAIERAAYINPNNLLGFRRAGCFSLAKFNDYGIILNGEYFDYIL